MSTVLTEPFVHSSDTAYEMKSLRIRRAEFADALTVVNLTSVSFSTQDFPGHVRFTRVSDVENLMMRGRFLLAEEAGTPVACAYVEPRPEASRLEFLAVSPERRRAGIGSQLLEAAEQLSRMMQCAFIHVRVMNFSRETLTFCRRRGYVEFEFEPLSSNSPFSPHCHLIKMCKHLDRNTRGF